MEEAGGLVQNHKPGMKSAKRIGSHLRDVDGSPIFSLRYDNDANSNVQYCNIADNGSFVVNKSPIDIVIVMSYG